LSRGPAAVLHGVEKLDLAAASAEADCGKRSVYLMDCASIWGYASTRGRNTEMEDAASWASERSKKQREGATGGELDLTTTGDGGAACLAAR